MTTRTISIAAAAGFALAALAAPQLAMAQPVTDTAVVQPTPGAPVTTSAPVYPAPAGTAPVGYAAGPPPMVGAVAGTTAADRDGDGIVDGYYTPDGFYHPFVVPAPPPAPRVVSRRGERG